MPRHAALIQLSQDHHHILVLALRLKKRGPATSRDLWPTELREQVQQTLQIATQDMMPHFRIEEEILFPAILQRTSDQKYRDLVEDLIGDHRAMEALLRRLTEPEATEVQLGDTLFELGILMEAHVRKEERGIFHNIHECVDPETLTLLQSKIEQAHADDRSLEKAR